jgi:hypothetical protein
MSESGSTPTLQRFIGYLTIAASVLWIAFCGLCAFWLIDASTEGGAKTDWYSFDAWWGILLVIALSGGGIAAGYALLLVGRGLAK